MSLMRRLLLRAFGPAYLKELGLTEEEFLALGRVDPANKAERYGLTPLAIRMCRSTNGVSRKHGEVSRALWQKLWPGKTLDRNSDHSHHQRSSCSDVGLATLALPAREVCRSGLGDKTSQ